MKHKFLPLLLTLFYCSFSHAQCNGSFLKTILFECDEPFDMDNRTTFGVVEGTWSGGSYITPDGVFTPTGLTAGNYTITFNTDSPPCSPSTNFVVTIAPTPEVVLTQNTLEICENGGLVNLTVYEDASSIPGYWEGTGLININTFDPSGLSGEIELSFIAYCDNDEPAVCPPPIVPNPVCGCDGVFYSSACAAELEGIITYTPWIPNSPVSCQPGGGCEIDVEILTITVLPSTDVVLTANNVTLCDTEIPVNLNDYVAPSSDIGTWNVPLIFDPMLSGAGNYFFEYSTGSSDCDDSATLSITVEEGLDIVLSQASLSICSDAPIVNLNNFFTASSDIGVWSGNGVDSATGIFDPSMVGSGVQTLTVGTGFDTCDDLETFVIVVNESTNAILNDASVIICSDNGLLDLSQYVDLSSSAGNWSGTGVNNGFFNPAAGSQALTYSTIPVGPCDDDATLNVLVVPGPDAILNTTIANVCITDGIIDLSQYESVSSDDGIWAGQGVTSVNSQFDVSAGSQTLTFTSISGDCQDTEILEIVVLPSAIVNLTQNSFSLCSTDAPISLSTFLGPNTGTGNWSGVGVANNTFDPSVGSQTVTYTTNLGMCDVSDFINITVTPPSIINFTQENVELCSTDAAIDLATFLGVGTDSGEWSGIGISGNTFNPNVGSQTLTYTTNLGMCDISDELNIEVSAPSDASTIPPSNSQLCTNSGQDFIQTLDLSTLITGENGGTWSYSPEANGFNPISGDTFNADGLPINTYTLTYTVDGGEPCGEVSSSQNIQVVECLLDCTADASFNPPPDLCAISGNVLDLNSLITGDVGGTWSTSAPLGTLTGTIFNADGLSGDFTITYTVMDEIADCPDAIQNASINIIAPTTATTIAPISNFCLTEAGFDLFNLVIGDSNGSWSSTDAPNAIDNTGFFSFDGVVAGQYVVTYTVAAQAPCTEDAVSSEIITIQDNDNTAGEDAEVCSMTTSLNAISSEEGFWGVSLTPSPTATAIFEDENDPQSTVTVNEGGAYTFFWSHIDPFANVCFDEDEVAITFSEPMEVNTEFICSADNLTYDLTATISGGYPPYNVDGIEIVGNTYGLTLNDEEAYSFVVDDSGNCDEIEVSGAFSCFCPPPADPITENLSYCEGTTIPTLSVMDNGVDTFSWYESETSNTSMATGISFTPSMSGTYWVEAISPEGCVSENRVEVTLEEIPLPNAPVAFSETEVYLCEEEGVNYVFEVEPSLEGIVNWYDMPEGGEPILENSLFFTGLSEGTYYAETMVLPDNCRSARTPFSLVINPLDDSSFSYPSDVFCLNESNPLPDFVATFDGTFSSPDGIHVDASTGEISLSELNTETEYTIEYQTNGDCPTTTSFTFNIVADELQIEAGEPIHICRNDPIVLDAEILLGTPNMLEWSANIEGSFDNSLDLQTTFQPTDTMSNFYLYLTAANNCGDVVMDSVQVLIEEIGELNVEGNTTLNLGQTTQLQVSGGNGIFQWTAHPDLSCTDCFNPIFTANTVGTTTLVVESNANCVPPLTLNITVIPPEIAPTLTLPNAFSPNGDGVNDEFRAISSERLESYYLQIYNRWGEQVFESTDSSEAWDGSYKDKMGEIGVYVYIIQYQFVGSNVELKQGNITLIF